MLRALVSILTLAKLVPRDGGVPRFGFGHDPFVSAGCPVTNCHVTDDRSLLPSLADFDAILFHARDMDRRIIQVSRSL